MRSPRRNEQEVYKNLIAQFERGDEVLVDPMDYVILGSLPPEGTLFAGAYPEGRAVKSLAGELFGGQLTSQEIAVRMRILRVLGLVVSAGRRGVHDLVWQITPKGKHTLEEWKEAPKETHEHTA